MNDLVYFKYRKLAMNLLNFRKSTRLDQIQFAEKCGVSRLQYLRAEAAHPSTTLQTLLKICAAFEIDIGDLFKDPFSQTLKIERREKVKLRGSAEKISEEKYLSNLNKNTNFKKILFGPAQVRKMKLENRTKLEIIVLKGELFVSFSCESKILHEGQHLAIDYDPQLSFEKDPSETFKLGSSKGAEVLLIQTAVY